MTISSSFTNSTTVPTGGGGGGSGTVTSVSVATANGFAGTVATPGTTPTITLTTNLTGLLKGNGTAMSAATAGTDYLAPPAGTALLKANSGGALANAAAGTDYVAPGGALGTPSSGTLTNCTGLPVSTGVSGLGTGVATFLATPSSANLAAALTDETGTGANVFATSPTLVTPLLGTPTSGVLTNCTGLPVSTGISGLGTGVATFLATPSSANLASALTDETGSGSLVFATSPALVSPLLGTPTSGVLTNCTGLPISTGVSGLATGAATFLSTAVGFETMIFNGIMGSAGTSLSSGTISVFKFLRIRIWIPGYAGSETASLQFNASGGTAYRYSWSIKAAAGTTWANGLNAVSTDRIKVGSANTLNARLVECIINNNAAVNEKMVFFTASVFATGSAATQATQDAGNGAWISAATTSITRIDLITTGGSNMNAGTQMTIFGWN